MNNFRIERFNDIDRYLGSNGQNSGRG